MRLAVNTFINVRVTYEQPFFTNTFTLYDFLSGLQRSLVQPRPRSTFRHPRLRVQNRDTKQSEADWFGRAKT